ncbi:MAG: hypothetical protein R6V12_13925 [Candidatus Hydrogenedentota bacterium]
MGSRSRYFKIVDYLWFAVFAIIFSAVFVEMLFRQGLDSQGAVLLLFLATNMNIIISRMQARQLNLTEKQREAGGAHVNL